MAPWLFELGLGAAALAIWAAAYGVALLITRPLPVAAAPASQELGPELPAVVSLVASGWELTEDGVEATLLDLGARKLYGFRQPANDPTQTTIHIGQKPPPADLTRYERAVYDRVVALAKGGLVPLTALTFRDPKPAQAWWRDVRSAIVDDARSLGLSRRRFGPRIITVLSVAAAIAGTGVGIAVLHALIHYPTDREDSPLLGAVFGGLVAFAVLSGVGARNLGERDTPLGREVAARWLGVRRYLRDNDGFAELPPSAVAVWDRYLGYGAALGVTRVSSAVIDMGMGNRRRVWSSYGGTWHRVRISYPRIWRRYGLPVRILVFRAVLAGAVGFILVRFLNDGFDRIEAAGGTGPGASTVERLVFAGGIALLGYAGYVLLRVILDAAVPRTFKGQVLWVELWRSHSGGESRPSVPWLEYAAIDDGSGDRTTAWALPVELKDDCQAGSTVEVTVRPWSRRITKVSTVEYSPLGHADAAVPPDPAVPAASGAAAAGARAPAVIGLLGRLVAAPDFGTAGLLTAEEVGTAMGAPVTIDASMPGPVAATTRYLLAQGNKPVLTIMAIRGRYADLAWRAALRQGTQRGMHLFSDIGDGALIGTDLALVRSGDATISLTLTGDGKVMSGSLHTLAEQLASRVPNQRPPSP